MELEERNIEEKVITVSELTRAITIALERNIGYVTVQGELSNFKLHTSGHRYFTLKDESAQISCVMWRGKAIRFTPADGMKVIIKGHLTVYPPRGQYQLECESIVPLGQGDLFLAFEALKRKLEELGYFEQERKRPIPDLPLHVGVSTSPTGAAIKDILSTLERRFPAATIYFRPTLVQGEGSAEDIALAIKQLQTTPAEVLIVGRGGGSLEDLWSYNTEIVADSIFNSRIPVISAVGHETDFTIADFVADLRAATPTAAAEIVSAHTSDSLDEMLLSFLELMENSVKEKINSLSENIDSMTVSYAFRSIEDKIKTHLQFIDELESQAGQNIIRLNSNLKQKLSFLENHCKSLFPLSPLKKGFAILQSEDEIIPKWETLGNFLNVDIVRENEIALASINKITPNKTKYNINKPEN
ncbi:MAG: exodeoxyribonuclease VII large subunit [FCB group bacterium]|jgi:exodeoxyribonuclease VII large subunit